MFRITTKLTLILAATGLLLFSLFGLYMLTMERQELRHAIEREMRLVSLTLQVAMEQALQANDRETVNALVAMNADEHLLEPAIFVAVLDADGALIAASGPTGSLMTDLPRHALQAAEPLFNVEASINGAERLIAALPLAVNASGAGGRLIVTRPLTDMTAELKRTGRDIAFTVAIFVLLTTVLGSLLGTVLVGRPLSRLGSALRRVQTGDLAPQIPQSRGRDEVGQLTGEFNRMVGALREARVRLDEEGAARQALQLGLQQADKLITIGQLSTGLAHEIGSPLQVLSGRARQLSGNSDLPEDVRSNAEIIAAQTERIARIVDQLLSYARRQPVRFATIDPVRMVDELVTFLGFDARRRRVQLRHVAQREVPLMVTEPDQLQQILFNLVTNALEATGAGGEVVIETAACLDPEAAGIDGSAVTLAVRDTGSGISETDRMRLFEPFFTTRAAEGGVGLGLAVVRTLVAEHGGRISVESEPGHGSRFTVVLPLCHPRAAGENT